MKKLMFIRQSVAREESQPQRIVILRALQLGDLLCAVPAFRSLRAALPDASITLIGLPWSKEFVRRFSHYLDHFIEFPGFPGFPERTPQIDRIPSFLNEVQQMDFDLALQMQGSGWLANSLVVLFGAIASAGFYIPGQYCPDENRFLVYPSQDHEVIRHLKLMDFLGYPSQGHHLEFPLYPNDWREFQDLQRDYGLRPGEYICIHPGSRAAERRWPTEKFASIADELAKRGYQIVLTGTEIEKSLTAKVREEMKFASVDLAGKTSLGGAGALISRSCLLICNDTGVSHVAAALDKPSVVLSSASQIDRWAPLDRSIHRIVEFNQVSASELVMQNANELLQELPVYSAGINIEAREASLK